LLTIYKAISMPIITQGLNVGISMFNPVVSLLN
jgi:hypothetical protein